MGRGPLERLWKAEGRGLAPAHLPTALSTPASQSVRPASHGLFLHWVQRPAAPRPLCVPFLPGTSRALVTLRGLRQTLGLKAHSPLLLTRAGCTPPMSPPQFPLGDNRDTLAPASGAEPHRGLALCSGGSWGHCHHPRFCAELGVGTQGTDSGIKERGSSSCYNEDTALCPGCVICAHLWGPRGLVVMAQTALGLPAVLCGSPAPGTRWGGGRVRSGLPASGAASADAGCEAPVWGCAGSPCSGHGPRGGLCGLTRPPPGARGRDRARPPPPLPRVFPKSLSRTPGKQVHLWGLVGGYFGVPGRGWPCPSSACGRLPRDLWPVHLEPCRPQDSAASSAAVRSVPAPVPGEAATAHGDPRSRHR